MSTEKLLYVSTYILYSSYCESFRKVGYKSKISIKDLQLLQSILDQTSECGGSLEDSISYIPDQGDLLLSGRFELLGQKGSKDLYVFKYQ